MVVTNPDVSAYQGMSMFLVPTDTPGVNIVRNVGLYGERDDEGSHALIHYDNVRVPDPGTARRRGPGVRHRPDPPRRRPDPPRDAHHRPVPKAMDMMCERALSRETAGSLLSDKQVVQGYIADSYAQLMQFRLMVLYTAWEIDKYNDYKKVRKDIAAVKVVMPTVLHDIAWRAMQVHGALGVTNEMPFLGMVTGAAVMGLADGPTEVHKTTVAKQVLRDYQPTDDIWPTEWIPRKREAARAKFAEYLETRGGQPVSEPTSTPRAWPTGWTSAALPGKGEPLHGPLPVRRHPERHLRTRPRRRSAASSGCHRPARRPTATRASCGSGASSRRSTAPTCRTPRRSACATDAVVLGRPFYLMGFVDGWSPMDQPRQVAASRSTATSSARPGLSYQLAEGIALLSKVDWKAKGLQDLGRPDGFHERQVDRWIGFLERIKNRELPGPRRRHRLAAGPQAARLHPRPDARRLPVRQRHVPARRPGAAGRDRRLGDGHRRRPEAGPGLDGAELAGRTTTHRTTPR